MILIHMGEKPEGFYLKVEGHSGQQGSSIVCAGVSALVESWRLSEELLEKIFVKAEKGLVEGIVPKTQASQVLFFQLTVGLKVLAQRNPKEIKIEIVGGSHGI